MGSPSGKNLVSTQEYDNCGRESKAWLPVSIASCGAYAYASEVKDAASSYYADDYAYRQTVYDNSPLDRITEQQGPGQAWRQAGKSVKQSYYTNTSTGDLACLNLFTTGTRSAPVLKTLLSRNHPKGTLRIIKEESEDGTTTYTFTNLQGQVILTRVWDGSKMLNTYYVYDNFGNLCFVLPPMLDVLNPTVSDLNKYAYQYRHDDRNRCIAKKLPGAEWIYYLYDAADNLVLQQDGEARSRKEWLCTLYDWQKRPVISGIYQGEAMRNRVSEVAYIATPGSSGSDGYSYVLPGVTKFEVQEVTYYDDYAFKTGVAGFTSQLDYVADPDYGQQYMPKAYSSKELVTGSIRAVLDGAGKAYSVTYYDERKRPIQTRTLQPDGMLSVMKFEYDLLGNVLQSSESHVASDGTAVDNLVKWNEYDPMGRLLRCKTMLNDGPVALLDYQYDDVGRLVKTIQGYGADTLSTHKQYNIRGWLTDMVSPQFSMSLRYTDPTYATPSYSGNIAEWSYDYGVGSDRKTDAFAYDPLSRLTDSRQYIDGVEVNKDVERNIRYDAHGNILHMERFENGAMRNITANAYNGNQLVSQMSILPSPLRGAFPPLDPDRPLEPGKPLPDPSDPLEPGKPLPDPSDPLEPPTEPTLPPGGIIILPDTLLPPPHPSVEPQEPEHDVAPGNPGDRVLFAVDPNTLYTGSTFRYDYNGNRVYTPTGERNIRYNRLNLLKKVFNSSKTLANYSYLADGTKLSVEDDAGNGFVYRGSFIYSKTNGEARLESVLFNGGQFVAVQNGAVATFETLYHVTDHLGSVRVVVDDTGAVREQNQYAPYGMRWDVEDAPASANPWRFNGKELQVTGNIGLTDFGARMYDSWNGCWITQDPFAEKYYSWSPYAFCAGNPIRFIDPYGMDIYRYDDKTGEMSLFRQTEDKFDQIGKFEYDKKNDSYTLKTDKKGNARTRMDNIEKGILSDGMNFMDNANVWETGGVGQPTIDGFQNFAIGFGEMIGKEVAGIYYSNIGQNNVSYIHMGRHQNNSPTTSYSTPGIYNVRPDLHGVVQPHTAWHTHPTNASTADRLRPSGLYDGSGDIGFKNNALMADPSQRPSNFMILTRGYAPIYY